MPLQHHEQRQKLRRPQRLQSPGRAPVCCEQDVTPAMVQAYRQRMKG